MQRDWQAQYRRPQARGKWPIYSDAMAVHPSQIEATERRAAELGVPVNIVKKDCPEEDRWAGQVEFTDQRHQNEYLRKMTDGEIVNLDKYG